MADPAGNAALELFEQSRETSWARPPVAGQLFLGRLLAQRLVPYAVQSAEDAAVGDRFLAEIEAFLKAHVDPDAIDRTGDMPAEGLAGGGPACRRSTTTAPSPSSPATAGPPPSGSPRTSPSACLSRSSSSGPMNRNANICRGWPAGRCPP